MTRAGQGKKKPKSSHSLAASGERRTGTTTSIASRMAHSERRYSSVQVPPCVKSIVPPSDPWCAATGLVFRVVHLPSCAFAREGGGARTRSVQEGRVVHSLSLTEISHVIALATAPAFLLGCLATLMAMLISRLARIVDRAYALDVLEDNANGPP